MYLLYIDDSGSINDPNTKFLVLAGVSVFERQTHWLETQVNEIASRFDPLDHTSIELHAGPMRGGKDDWVNFYPDDRVQAVVDVLSLLDNTHSKIEVFGSVIEKSLLKVDDIIPHAFEKLAVAFDESLALKYQRSRNAQRGIVIFDKSTFEQNIQGLTRVFKHTGHSNGRLRNFSEVPLFLDSKASRLIQIADMVAYWIFRRYQNLDDRGYQMIAPYIPHIGGMHGVYELVSDETKMALGNIPVQKYPFPTPTPYGVKLHPVKRKNYD